jgi:hypothetical protein
MGLSKSQKKTGSLTLVPDDLSEDVTEEDRKRFFEIVSTDLNRDQVERIVTPPASYPKEKSVLAVHWHPEFVSLDLISRRIDALFPNRDDELIIPTQHNVLMSFRGYTGVEVDCYSWGFNQKVQLLVHFEDSRVEDAPVFRSILAHTFKYRSSQLFDFIRTITAPREDWIKLAARETGADGAVVRFVQVNVRKIEKLLEEHGEDIPVVSIKNKLLRNFFDTLRETYGDGLIDRVQTYLRAVKMIVKAHFPLKYFYRTSDVIAEARSIGGGIVIPHPEQFWPILLADYDVDGYEIWNPESRRYTEFLITVLHEKNKQRPRHRPELLLFMGDDTHMGEKVKDPAHQDLAKASREIGLQTAWSDLMIKKKLIVANMDKNRVIREYKSRLAG